MANVKRKLAPGALRLLNRFQDAAIDYGKVMAATSMDDDIEQSYRDEMLKARYLLEEKMIAQGVLAQQYMSGHSREKRIK